MLIFSKVNFQKFHFSICFYAQKGRKGAFELSPVTMETPLSFPYSMVVFDIHLFHERSYYHEKQDGDCREKSEGIPNNGTRQGVHAGERQLIKKYRKLSAGGKEEMIHYLDFRLSSEAPRVEKRFKNILSVIFRERK